MDVTRDEKKRDGRNERQKRRHTHARAQKMEDDAFARSIGEVSIYYV